MNYEERVLAYIDILGFQNLIGKTIDGQGRGIPDEVSRLRSIISNITSKVLPAEEWERDLMGRPGKSSIIATQFSDSLVASCRVNQPDEICDIILPLFYVQKFLIKYGIVCRGGIAMGQAIHTPDVLFGPAMVSAHKLESEAAHYPRILMNEELFVLAKESKNPTMDGFGWLVEDLVRRDGDGLYFINYFDNNIGRRHEVQWSRYRASLRSLIDLGLQNKDEGKYIKYAWMDSKYLEISAC